MEATKCGRKTPKTDKAHRTRVSFMAMEGTTVQKEQKEQKVDT